MGLSIDEVPFRMDASNQASWWKPIDEHEGVLYVAYNGWGDPGGGGGGATDTHTVFVARRSPDGEWTAGCCARPGPDGTPACAVFADDVGQRQPSLAVDGAGFVHVFAAMHDDPWVYYRSGAPGDVTTLVDRSAELPDQPGAQTYPSLCTAANGDVHLFVRSDRGARLYRWDHGRCTWARLAIVAAEADHLVYPDDVVCDGTGRVHLAWEWAYGLPNGLRHLGSYLRYEPDADADAGPELAGRFTDAAGAPVDLPLTATGGAADATTTAFQPVEGDEQLTDRDGPTRPPGVQSAKLAVDEASGHPLVAYRHRARAGGLWQVWLAEWTGGGWSRSPVYDGPDETFGAVDVSTHDRAVRVYYVRSTGAGPVAVVATRPPGGTWTETELAADRSIERLSVLRRGRTDHLYLAAPTTHTLHVAALPW